MNIFVKINVQSSCENVESDCGYIFHVFILSNY